MKHTPGPLEVVENRNMVTNELEGYAIIANGPIAYIRDNTNGMENVKANAYLWAAAPSLLAALEEIQKHISRDKRFNIRDDFTLFNHLACAINQARGKS